MTSTIGDLFVRLGLDMSDLSSGLGAAEKRMERFGTQMFFLGTRITAGISLPVGAALASIAEFGLGFDKAMTESLAIMDNMTSEMRAQMEAVAKTVSSTTKFSSEEAAKGYFSLASAGLNAAEAMGALPIAARFAQAGVMDLAKATDFLATAQATMQKEGETASEKVADMARVADVLTEANNRAIGTIQDFAEALTNKAGAALRQSDKSIEEGTAVLAAYAAQGIKGKEAGQQLWMSIRDLGIAALKHRDAFDHFKISVFDASGAMSNMADIIGDFERATEKMSVAERRDMFLKLGMPSRSVAATNALIGFSDAIRTYQAQLEASGGVTQTVADRQMQALSNQMSRLGHEFQNAAIDLFKTFIPVIQDYLIPLGEKALSVVKEMAGWVGNLSGPWKLAALGVTAFVVALGPAVAMFGSMTLLTAGAMRGIKGLADILGFAAVQAAETAGVSQVMANMLAIMPTRAAAAAAGAYEAAKASGAWGAALNRAATNAANAAGWEGRVTNALIAQGLAASETTVATTSSAASLNLLTGAGVGALTKLASFGVTVLEWGASMLKWKIIIDLLYPAAKSLFDGLVELIGAVIPSITDLGGAWDTLVAGPWKVFNDAIFLSSQGLKFLVDATKDIIRTQVDLHKSQDDTAKAQDALNNVWKDQIPIIGPITGGIREITAFLDRHKETVDKVKAAWEELVMYWHDNELLEVALPKQVEAMRPPTPKQFQPPKGGEFKTGIEAWMLGTQKDFDRHMAEMRKGMEGAMPTPDPKKLTAAQSAIQNLANTWEENSKQIKTFEGAWNSLSAVQKSDVSVLDHVWQSYDTLRHSQGYVNDEMEKLFANQLGVVKNNQDVEHSFNDLANTWSDAATHMIDKAGATYNSLQQMSQTDVDAFFKKHENTIEELIPRYGELDVMGRSLVDMYQAWALRTAQLGGALQGVQHKASQDISDYLASATAKLADAQTNLTLFSKSYADKELSGLKKGLAEQEVARSKSYREQLNNLAVFANDPILFAAEFARLTAAKKANDAIADAEHRLGLYRIAESVGVSKGIIKNFDHMTDQEIEDIIRAQEAWESLLRSLTGFNTALSNMGTIFSDLGLTEIGNVLTGIAGGIETVYAGMDKLKDAENFGQKLAAVTTMISGVVKAYKTMSDIGSRGGRVASGALTGASIGAMFGPVGMAVGAGIGGLVGLFTGDPNWKKLQNAVSSKWGETVSKELAKTIDNDSKMLGGRVNAMLMHLSDVAAESGGITAQNVGKWATRLAETFSQVSKGAMSAAQGAKTLDTSFGDLLKSGTASNGLINDQVRDLVLLEQKYKLGSAAIRDFISAQMDLVSGGFEKVVKGVFGAILGQVDEADAADTKLDALRDKALKLQAVIADFERRPPTTEKQKVQLLLAQRDLLTTNAQIRKEEARQAAADATVNELLSPSGQDQFDRLGRLASVTFNAMIGSGKSLVETLEVMGPALDLLIAAQAKFGFTSSDTFTQLMKFREFADMNPELVDSISGLNNMMVGLSNTGFLTQETFTDLGAQITSTFDKLVAGGLTGDEAMQLMQPTLQTLWELQHKFGLKVDESTQKLIDQAIESGKVGVQYMSANDRMVLGIQTLIDHFDLFLHHLGIDIPQNADTAADGINNAGKRIDPWTVPVTYTDPGDLPGPDQPPEMAKGGLLTGPRTVKAGEAGPEAIIPLDRLFDQLDAQYARTGTDGEGYMPVNMQIDGDTIMRTLVKVAKKKGWTR